MQRIAVELSSVRYPIFIGRQIVENLGDWVEECQGKKLPDRTVMIVTDQNVGPFHLHYVQAILKSKGFHILTAALPPGEHVKTLKYASQLWDQLIEASADRQVVLVALGGGVIGDLTGFVAALYARGVPFVQVPTTLLSMVDASVGGKVAVDHPKSKNMIGAFHQPLLVICDLEHLNTLPDRDFTSGLAEVVKYGVIMDAEFFEYMEKNAEIIKQRDADALTHCVAQSCRLKAQVVKEDERETTGRRAILNYGHTFAHAFETALGYEGLTHGEAVAIGMMCAARLGEKLGICTNDVVVRQWALWNRLGLPTRLPVKLLTFPLVEIMGRDKKALAGRPRFIVPTRIGEVQWVHQVEPELVNQVLKEFAEN